VTKKEGSTHEMDSLAFAVGHSFTHIAYLNAVKGSDEILVTSGAGKYKYG